MCPSKSPGESRTMGKQMTTAQNKASLNIEMPGVDFAGMAREAIAAKLTESLVGADAAIQGIVAAALAEKVDNSGNKERYSGGIPFVEWLARDLIRKAAIDAVTAKVEQLRPAITKQIEAQLSKNVKSIAMSLTDTFIKRAADGYGVTMNVTAEMRVRD
jgi:hypothetical protein